MKTPKYKIEYLDYNKEYLIRNISSWYGDQGAVSKLHDLKHLISVDGEIHDDFSLHKRLCPKCRGHEKVDNYVTP